ncbi:hypothetical protein [Catenibacterium faecis]|nr:hypothetical protein [Catenibacterium faecis]
MNKILINNLLKQAEDALKAGDYIKEKKTLTRSYILYLRVN